MNDYFESEKQKIALEKYKKRISELAEKELQERKKAKTTANLEDFNRSLSTDEYTDNVREHYRSKLQEKLETEGDYTYSVPYTPSVSKGEQFDEAWRNLIHYGDSKLFDEIVHSDYYSMNQGVKLNKDTSRRVLLTRKGKVVMGPFEILYENDEFLGIQRYSRVNLYTWFSMISCVKYKDGKVFTQWTVREPLQTDPSIEEGWDWNDYKP